MPLFYPRPINICFFPDCANAAQILPFLLPVQLRNIACSIRCPDFDSLPALFYLSQLVHVVVEFLFFNIFGNFCFQISLVCFDIQ